MSPHMQPFSFLLDLVVAVAALLQTDLQWVLQPVVERHFAAFGEVESVNVIWDKAIAFVRFRFRSHAELAKEAMAKRIAALEAKEAKLQELVGALEARATRQEERVEHLERDLRQLRTEVRQIHAALVLHRIPIPAVVEATLVDNDEDEDTNNATSS